MDYVFVPERWRLEAVEVGAFEDYTERGLSDHVPVIVTVSPE
jgi:endonuclease/exonuclease/phosphatase family metal-dependent hydrolase